MLFETAVLDVQGKQLISLTVKGIGMYKDNITSLVTRDAFHLIFLSVYFQT